MPQVQQHQIEDKLIGAVNKDSDRLNAGLSDALTIAYVTMSSRSGSVAVSTRIGSSVRQVAKSIAAITSVARDVRLTTAAPP